MLIQALYSNQIFLVQSNCFQQSQSPYLNMCLHSLTIQYNPSINLYDCSLESKWIPMDDPSLYIYNDTFHIKDEATFQQSHQYQYV